MSTTEEFEGRRCNGYFRVASPDYDNTMVNLVKLSPPTQSNQLLKFQLKHNQYAQRHALLSFLNI